MKFFFMRRHLCATLSIAALLPTTARAQELSSDRPDVTNGATVVRAPQLEAGYTFTRAGSTSQHAIGELMMRLGVSERVELRLAANSFDVARDPGGNSSGLENPGAGVKLRLTRAIPAAIIAGSTIPVGTTADHDHSMSPSVVLAVEPPLGLEPANLGINLGITSEKDGSARRSVVSASASAGLDLPHDFGMYVEGYGNDPGAFFVDIGVERRLTRDLQVDLRVGGSVSHERERYIGAGFTRRFARGRAR